MLVEFYWCFHITAEEQCSVVGVSKYNKLEIFLGVEHMSTEKGRVKWFNDDKGFGFIERSEGDDVFVHYSAINGNGRKTLCENDSVEFTVTQGKKGLEAENVTVVETA